MRLSRVVVLLGILLGLGTSVLGDPDSEHPFETPLIKSFGVVRLLFDKPENPNPGGAVPTEARGFEYISNKGAKVSVDQFRFQQETQAYELLSLVAAKARGSNASHTSFEIG